MSKYVCIKEIEVYSSKFFKLKVGDIIKKVDIDFSYAGIAEPNSEVFWFNEQMTLCDWKEFKTSFISLAEWREYQIDKILDDDESNSSSQ